MGERRVLVIGSQCAALPQSPLGFLPKVARDFHAAMTDVRLGDCVPALKTNDGLLVDPSVEEAWAAIEAAFESASADSATLFLAYIGHGDLMGGDFYLLPQDARMPPSSRSAVLLAQELKELIVNKGYDRLDGLVVLVDACHAGSAARATIELSPAMEKSGLRFQLFASAASDRAAADGCFTATMIESMTSGVEGAGPYLRCNEDFRRALLNRCGNNQVPQFIAYDGSEYMKEGDVGLWLSHNVKRSPLAGTRAWPQIQALTTYFQVTSDLDRLVGATQDHQCVAIVGATGRGKATLAAALSQYKLVPRIVPERFVDAFVFASATTTLESLGREVARQLESTVDGFVDATVDFRNRTAQEEWLELSTVDRFLLGPLETLNPSHDVRLVVARLDLLTPYERERIVGVLETLTARLSAVRVIVTSLPGTLLPFDHFKLEVAPVETETVKDYLKHREVPVAQWDRIEVAAQGNWLRITLSADNASPGGDIT